MFVACSSLMACDQKEEAVYDQSYVQRTNATVTEYSKVLEEAPNGWLLRLYPGENQYYGGYNFIVSFAGGKVTAVSEVNTTEATSDYSLSFNEKVILSFDTYNEVLHQFVEPSYLFPRGKEGGANSVLYPLDTGTLRSLGRTCKTPPGGPLPPSCQPGASSLNPFLGLSWNLPVERPLSS